ncbi:hypothetical protein C8Q78DRAFT_1079173 [Trametes maxima]|nr:hypothetical protein C8Q78DRAFT_1079173 [Trametes maxima]
MTADPTNPHGDDRPALSDRSTWALSQDKDNRFTVQRRSGGSHNDTAHHSMKTLLDGGAFAHLKRLDLLLDGRLNDSTHGHSRYDPFGDCNSPLCADETFPNVATEQEVVQLAGQLGGRLVELRVALCKPELVVPHIPLLVYDLVEKCPSLEVLSVQDVQCEWFLAPSNCTADHVRYLAAIAYNEHREAVSRRRSPSRLHTLTIGRRSTFPHEHLCCSFVSKWLPHLEKDLRAAVDGQHRADSTSHACALKTKRDVESSHLTALMTQEFPSLLDAWLVLDRNLERVWHAQGRCAPTIVQIRRGGGMVAHWDG